jgi:tripartite-type tricarboxylate transporter receptor subunit TctC
MLLRRLAVVIFSVIVIILCAGLVFGQDFPNKPIRIVTAEAGGGSDVVIRIISQALSVSLGQQIIIDNRGGGLVAGEVVSKAPPDGYTLLFYANSFWLMPLMRSHVPYDPVKDFVPISVIAESPNVLVVHPKVAAHSVKELVALAKARPGQLNYGSAATGTSNHLAAELFKSMTGTDIVRIPFKGSASALTALVTGEVQLMFPTPTNAMPYVAAGRLKLLAVTSMGPSELTPGVPTMAASGVPGYKSSGTFILFAPARTPAPIIKRLNQEIVRVLHRAEVKDRIFKTGAETIGSSLEEARELIQSELVSMGKVIKDANIRDE